MTKETLGGLPLHSNSGQEPHGKRDFSELPLRKVGLIAGKDRLDRLTGDMVIVLGLPEMTGEAVRRGHKRAVDGVNAVRKDIIRRKDGMIQSIRVYSQQEWEAFTNRMNKIKKGAQSGFQKGVEMATTGVEFVVGGLVFVAVGTLATGETIWRVSVREVKALPKEAKAAVRDFKANWESGRAQALFAAAEAKRTSAVRDRMKARRHRENAQEIRTRYAKNTKFKLK